MSIMLVPTTGNNAKDVLTVRTGGAGVQKMGEDEKKCGEGSCCGYF
jgi:hypothetical protein